GIRARFLIQMSPKRSEGEESEYLFFDGDGGYGVAGDDYERPQVFDDDQYEEDRYQFMILILKMSLRKKKNLSRKKDLVRKKTTSKTS
ncbi:hypothetical protein Tco_1497469, partial [Tanacetum coccineum]